MVPSFLPTTNEFGLVGWKAKDMTQAWPPPIVATISPGVDLDRILIVSPEEEDKSPLDSHCFQSISVVWSGFRHCASGRPEL